MCVYCSLGDFTWRNNPPFYVNPIHWPQVPQPPILPEWFPKKEEDKKKAISSPNWDRGKIREFYEILKSIKELEDKIGCPCVPNKADYLKLIRDHLKEIEEL